MSTFILPQRPEDVPAAFAERFNSGDPDAVRALYEPGAAFVPESGVPVRGAEAIAAQNAPFIALGLPISVRPRHVHVAGDTALLVVDWEIDGKVRATATDVARRGADGYWRYVIDSPFGAGRREDGGGGLGGLPLVPGQGQARDRDEGVPDGS